MGTGAVGEGVSCAVGAEVGRGVGADVTGVGEDGFGDGIGGDVGGKGVGCAVGSVDGVGFDPPQRLPKFGQESRFAPLWKQVQPIHSHGTMALLRAM